MIHLMLAVTLFACDGKTTQAASHAEPGAPVIANAGISLDRLLKKHYDAQGGYEVLKSIQTIRLEGRSTGPEGEATFTKTMKRPNLFRADGTKAGKAWSKAFDGTAGAVVTDGVVKPIEGDALAHFKAMSFDDELVDWKARGHEVELVGLSTVRGELAYKLKLTLANGDVQWRWLDKKTALETQRVVSGTHEGKAYTKTLRFADYRKVDGSELVVNHSWSWESAEGKGTTTFETITVNSPVDDRIFHLEQPQS